LNVWIKSPSRQFFMVLSASSFFPLFAMIYIFPFLE
jgi:hypothetical protein